MDDSERVSNADVAPICGNCGTVNAANAEFCVRCGRFVGFESGSGTHEGRTLTSQIPVVTSWSPPDRATGSDVRSAAPSAPSRSSAGGHGEARPPRVEIVTPELTIDPEGGGTFDLRVHNISTIVDRFRAVPLDAPGWLKLTHPAIALYPDEEKPATISVVIDAPRWPAAQRFTLPIRVHSDEDPDAATDVALALTVPPIGDPAQLHVEPERVRLRDGTSAKVELKVDNRSSNYPQRFELSGSDAEDLLEFEFSADVIEVPPGETVPIGLAVLVPPPEAGSARSYRATIRGANDQAEIETHLTIEQEVSALQLRLEPSTLKAADAPYGQGWLIIDNRKGGVARHVQLSGRDPEGSVRVLFYVAKIDVAAGSESRVGVRAQLVTPPKEPETSKPFTVVATDGTREATVDGTLIQTTSPNPITTAEIRLEPEQVTVRDRTHGRCRVAVDNTRGLQPLKVRLNGSDPERAVGFEFEAWALEVPPGGVSRVAITVSAPPPPGGETISREIRVVASNEDGSVKTQGAFVQTASPAPITLARIRLEPEQFTVHNSSRGQLRVVVDNRSRALPLRARLMGRDPENAVQFSFDPPTLNVPPGQAGWAKVTVRAPRPRMGHAKVRNLEVGAKDGGIVVDTGAVLTQTSDDLLPLIRIAATLLGGLIALIGAFLPWTGDARQVPLLTVRRFPGIGDIMSVATGDDYTYVTQPIARAVVIVLIALMLIGILRPKGGMTIIAGLLSIAATIGFAVYANAQFAAAPGGNGLTLMVVGCLLGCIGGLCIRRKES
ncbi:hypothetical protein BKE56_000765 [Rhodococcus sp. M8]|nr:hypothetical protein BKE56_000765 [Rhodococcus sp. M8]